VDTGGGGIYDGAGSGGGAGACLFLLRKRDRECCISIVAAGVDCPGAGGGSIVAGAGGSVGAGGVDVEGLWPAGYCLDAAREMGGRGGIFLAYAH